MLILIPTLTKLRIYHFDIPKNDPQRATTNWLCYIRVFEDMSLISTNINTNTNTDTDKNINTNTDTYSNIELLILIPLPELILLLLFFL